MGKMSKIKAVLLLAAVLFIVPAMPQNSYADRRGYVWTYEYQTMPKGRLELEYYLTEEQPNIDKRKPNTWKHWIEAEYGITDHWDIAMYQMFRQSNKTTGDKFEYDGFKVRTRYRILEKDKLPIDTLLYLEYIRNDNLDEPNKLEGKLILAKDIGDFNIAYNQIVEQELASDGETAYEYATGVSYKILPSIRVGVESKGSFSEREYFVGPTIAWWPGKFFLATGMAWGLNARSDDLQVRMITGFNF
jgi:hypothetical protein